MLDLDWFYNMLDLVLKNTRITLLDLDWFYDILDLDLDWHWARISQWAKQEDFYKSMKTFLNFCFLNIALFMQFLQLHLLIICAWDASYPARGVSEIRRSEDLACHGPGWE